jgi:hypothetical protein
MDQTTKNKEPNGTSGTFKSAEVMQSTINFLDGELVQTVCCRRVFCELFTDSTNSNCPGADGAFDRILRNSSHFPGKATLIEIHPSSSDGYYSADSLARANWYNYANQLPTAIFDGLYCVTGGAGSNPNATNVDTMYKNIINQRQPGLPDIDMKTFGQKTETTGWINLSIELLTPTPLRNLKVQFMVVEDLYPAKTSHNAYLRYTLRDMLLPEDLILPNHPPTIKGSLPDVNIVEDNSDSTTIQLAPAFEDEDLDVLTYFSDRDGDDKQNIKVEIDENGNVTFTPDDNWNGEEDITFYGDDGVAEPVGQSVKVTVEAVNDPPFVANPMVDFSMYEDLPINEKFNLSFVFNDIDMDQSMNANPQGPLQYSYDGNTNIEVSIFNNWVGFDPKPNWNGEETITIAARDFEDVTITDDVKIKVTSENDPPKLISPIPYVELNEDEILKDFIDLNEYFSDQDGDTLTFEFDESENIKTELNYTQDSVYVTIIPNANYWGTEIIKFNATDIPGTTPLTTDMEIIVNSVNDVPILNKTANWNIISSDITFTEDTITMFQDSPVKLYVTAYDPADNDKLTFSDNTNLFGIKQDTGEISFTPTYEDVGEYNVTISVDDGYPAGKAEKNIIFIVEHVNTPPETPVIITPKDDTSFIEGQNIEFKGTCDDQDLYIEDNDEFLSFEWTANDGSSIEVLSLDSEFSTTLKPGTYEIMLIVTDRVGEKGKATITISVDIDKSKDTDNDGTPDYLDEDDDGDGMPDEWENKFPGYLNPLNPSDAYKDPDNDKFTNLEEFLGNDGEPGGDDSTNPTEGSSYPKSDGGGDGASGEVSYAYLIGAAVGVIIVILLLVFLFMFKRKQKLDAVKEQESTTTAQPPAEPKSVDQTKQPQQAQVNVMPVPVPYTPMQQPTPGVDQQKQIINQPLQTTSQQQEPGQNPENK